MPPKASKKTRTPRPPKISQTATALPVDDDAIVRLPTVLAVFPVGATTWDNGVAAGKFPRPVRLTARTRGWKAGDIRALLASVGTDQGARQR